MAEGSDIPSIKDGSDADFEFTCTPCGEDNIREEAVKYCPECHVHLCVTCVRYHSRLKTLKSHKLLDRDDIKKGSVVAKTTKCRYHESRDIEMYCGAHDMVYCTKCIATEHRSCSGVVGIEEVQNSYVQQNEVQRLQDETRNIQERLQTVDKKKLKNLKSLEEQRNAILDQVQDTELKLIEHISRLKADTTDALNEHYTKIRDDLKSDITGIEKEIEESINQLDTVTTIDSGQQFVQIKLIQNTIADAKKLIENNESVGTKSVSFTENTDLKTSIITATSLGQVRTNNEKNSAPRQYRVISKKKINVRMQRDRNCCYITDVCQLQDGTIILTDFINKKIKKLDIDYSVQDHCDINSNPMGICCTGQNEVAVKMSNNKIQFISVGNSLSQLREISIKGGGFFGMAYRDGELWVSAGSQVDVYNTSGTLLKYINKDMNGLNIFKGSTSHISISGEAVIVTDDKDGAVFLGREGTVKQEFRDGRLVSAKGASISSDGTVFLSGCSSNNIMMFRLDGNCLGELVSKDDGLTSPLALCYDNKCKCLIVTSVSSDTIHIFMCD